jgi:hypothetical protein
MTTIMLELILRIDVYGRDKQLLSPHIYSHICAEIAIGGETNINIRWVYIMEIAVYDLSL